MEWYGQSEEIWFFPDYTDHGPNHLQRVLELADFLINDNENGENSAFDILTSSDALALIESIMLHDAAMHLSAEQFACVISNENHIQTNRGSSKRWPLEWERFLGEAFRWSSKQQNAVFGSLIKSSDSRAFVRNPPLEAKDQNDIDRRLIGEFLRRHHHELALDIAVNELPGLTQVPSLISKDQDVRMISGLIAWSHGVPVRDAVKLAEIHFNNARRVAHIHVAFLMAVIRIADYLHLHAERAADGRKDVTKRHSPISQREFLSHAAIRDIHFDNHPDREAVFVEVNSNNVALSTVLNIRDNWLEGINSELSYAWGELGKIYSRFPSMNSLGLTVRRVDSNIWSEEFTKNLDFYPVRASFRSADSDFLKLLVAPLYGDKPEIGIRELVQNAVDAVRERLDIDQHDTAPSDRWKPIDSSCTDADVLISLVSDPGQYSSDIPVAPPTHWKEWVEITDRGVGMTQVTVLENLLVAGASFRNTTDWKIIHEDERGSSRVLRAGRFGIGALAAFLLGPEIQVVTRHIAEEEGISFQAKLEDDQIELLKRVEVPVGTTVRVMASEKTVEELFGGYGHYEWDWYQLNVPKLVRRIQNPAGGWDEIESKSEKLPACKEDPLPSAWRRIDVEDFRDVQWTYCDEYPALSCNGLVVKWSNQNTNWSFEVENYYSENTFLAAPNISVFDADGQMPLNLARDSLMNPLPFEESVKRSIIRDLLAHALVFGPDKHMAGKDVVSISKRSHPSLRLLYRDSAPSWVFTENGFLIVDPHVVNRSGVDRIVSVISFQGRRFLPSFKPPSGVGLYGFHYVGNLYRQRNFMDWMASGSDINNSYLCPNIPYDLGDNPLNAFHSSKMRVLCDRNLLQEIEQRTRRKYSKDAGALHDQFDKHLIIIDSDEDLPSVDESVCAMLASRNRDKGGAKMGLVTEWYLCSDDTDVQESLIAELWSEIIGPRPIPYKMDLRKKELASAFNELDQEIALWQTEFESGLSKKKKLRQSKQELLAQGGYPKFLHANQVKQYLKANGITQNIIVRKYENYDYLPISPVYGVFVRYTRDELKEVNPDTPDHGDPFVVPHPPDQLPDYLKIEQLLKDSNASVTVMGPDKEIQE